MFITQISSFDICDILAIQRRYHDSTKIKSLISQFTYFISLNPEKYQHKLAISVDRHVFTKFYSEFTA